MPVLVKQEELDKRLDELLYDVRTDFDYNQDGNKVVDQGNAHFIEKIKQAFIDVGWFTPPDADLVQQVVDFRAQQKIDRVHHVADFSHGKLSELMTGQEWHDRFRQYYDRHAIYSTDSLSYRLVQEESVLIAAKKAAGIE